MWVCFTINVVCDIEVCVKKAESRGASGELSFNVSSSSCEEAEGTQMTLSKEQF